MGILAKPLGWLLSLLYGVVGNYGISIVIITVIVKLILYPFYKKQIMSTAGMSDIQPKIQEIQRKYANDKETMNAKMAELYQQENFNPMGGCLPMIVQMIIIMGLFALVRNPMIYLSDDSMYFAIHESFLWIKDLSQPDLWILPLAAGRSHVLLLLDEPAVGFKSAGRLQYDDEHHEVLLPDHDRMARQILSVCIGDLLVHEPVHSDFL